MVKRYFFYQVPEEKHSEYLRVTSEVLKPYWEAHGCRAYNVYQEAEKPTAFIKEMVFDDLQSMSRSSALAKTDAKAGAVVAQFLSFATNVSTKDCIQKI